MPFNSLTYCGFLAAAVFFFWQLPVSLRRPYVLGVSVLFYATWSPVFVLVPIAIAGVSYAIGSLILKNPGNDTRWFRLGIALVVATLAVFKYQAFFADNLTAALRILGLRPLGRTASIALPLGISFYSFEAIGYLIDTHQRRNQNRSFVDLLLLLLFWPTVISGPIVRIRELAPQLKFSAPLDPDLFFSGLDRIIWGLVQKNAIANVLGTWVDSAFKSNVRYSTLDSWVLVTSFGLQIYFDFAAYSNMAIGAARLIGIRLPENFRYPYHATTPVDFWARWHMSLSRWIRDYLFFPIGARHSNNPAVLYLSLIAVMGVVGLWHGAGWNYVIWGLLHGVWLVSYRLYERVADRAPGSAGSWPSRWAWRAFTLAAVTLAWAPFRAADGAQTLSMLSSMLGQWHWTPSFGMAFYIAVAVVAAFTAIEPYVAGALAAADAAAATRGDAFFAGRLMARPVLYVCGFLIFSAFESQNAQFIYFQF